jgi:starch synthase
MKVLFIAAEVAPFAKTGGLGDVVGSLPQALTAQGLDVRVVMPHYSIIAGAEHRFDYTVPRKSGDGDVTVHSTTVEDVTVYFLKSWPYFIDDGKIYTTADWDTPRFIYFSQMAMALVWQLIQGADADEDGWTPDLLHVHDWHTGMVPFLLWEARFNPIWQDIASVMTIHNMAFQGDHAGGFLWEEGFNNRDHPALNTQDLKDNMLGIGLIYADKLNTVSPNHATELHDPRFGEGLETLIHARDDDFSGILNGIDTKTFNPKTDSYIKQKYDADDFLTKRPSNKRALQKALGFKQSAKTPLIGIISRLTVQKGLDFATPALRTLLEAENIQLVVLGLGDPVLQAALKSLETDFPKKASVLLKLDFAFAQQIYAGADMLLVPSRYEPCGLTQMIAMRYGCLPVVRETGGLADTVDNYDNADAEIGMGFVFLFEEADPLVTTLQWVLTTFRDNPAAWHRMQERGMRHDWGWGSRAEEYVELYEAALDKKQSWKQ